MIIDSHVHLDVFSGKEISLKQRISNLKKTMKTAGISKSIILACIDSCNSKVKIIPINELLASIHNKKGMHLVGTTSILKHSRKDINYLEYLLKKKKIIGIKLYPGYEAFYPADKRCEPVYKLCEKFSVPVIFHSGETYKEGAGVKYSMPIHIDEVAVKHPSLKIVIAHMGNPWTNETMVIVSRNKNAYADISGLVWKSFDTFWHSHFETKIIQTLKFNDEHINKLLFGTDWPCNDESAYWKFTKEYVNFVNRLKLSSQDKEAIFYKNARKVFNI